MVRGSIVVAVVVGFTGVVRADAPGAVPPGAPDETSYRGTLVAADLGAAALFAGIATRFDDNAQSTGIVVPGMLAFGLSGTIVHLAHGNLRGAARSLALRTALPVLGGVAGWYLFRCGTQCPGREFGIPYAQEGVLLGEFAASAIDAVWFAHAGEPRAARIKMPADSYSNELLLADLAGATAVVAMIAMPVRQSEPVVASLAGYLAFAPITHLLHDNPRGAAASLALRVGLPLTGGLVAYSLRCRDCQDGSDDGEKMFAGVVLGALLAIAIDDVVLPYRETHAPPVTPIVAPTPSGATVGISGAF